MAHDVAQALADNALDDVRGGFGQVNHVDAHLNVRSERALALLRSISEPLDAYRQRLEPASVARDDASRLRQAVGGRGADGVERFARRGGIPELLVQRPAEQDDGAQTLGDGVVDLPRHPGALGGDTRGVLRGGELHLRGLQVHDQLLVVVRLATQCGVGMVYQQRHGSADRRPDDAADAAFRGGDSERVAQDHRGDEQPWNDGKQVAHQDDQRKFQPDEGGETHVRATHRAVITASHAHAAASG